MAKFNPRAPDWEERVRNSFDRQNFMKHIGAKLVHCKPGEIDLELQFGSELTQQHDFFHAGVSTSIADSAAGYAALSLFREGTGVLTTEFKINLLNPGKGEKLLAKGRVVKPGRTLSVCKSDVFATENHQETHVATGLFTMMCVETIEG